MGINWADYAGLTPAGCLPCCAAEIPPEENYCQCLFYFPFNTAVFANYNVAASAISTQTNNCIAYVTPNQNVFIATSAAAALNVSANTAANFQHIWASITVGANVALNIAFNSNAVAGNNLTSISTAINVYHCNGDSFSSNTNTGAAGVAASGYFLPPVLITPAQYYLEFYTLGFTGSSAVNSVWGLSSNQNIVTNPAVALWDDSGTTRQLEACPKMLIPTDPWGGTWYADATSAATAITDLTFDCYGYTGTVSVDIAYYSFSGTRATYTFPATATFDSLGISDTWFSVNLVAGDTATITAYATCSVSGCSGTPIVAEQADAIITIYDIDGNVIATVSSSTSASATTTATDSFTVPHTGKYYVVFNGSATQVHEDCLEEDPTASGSVYGECTSDGTVTANPIQALYDVSLTCPARDDC